MRPPAWLPREVPSVEKARPPHFTLRYSIHTMFSKWQKPGARGGGWGWRRQREVPAVWNRVLRDYTGVGTGRDSALPFGGTGPLCVAPCNRRRLYDDLQVEMLFNEQADPAATTTTGPGNKQRPLPKRKKWQGRKLRLSLRPAVAHSGALVTPPVTHAARHSDSAGSR